jgi:hypothetical protein
MITDVPEVARRVIDRRDAMSDAQRYRVALLIRPYVSSTRSRSAS